MELGNPKTRWIIGRVLPFGVIWLLIGWIFLITENAVIEARVSSPTTDIDLNPPIVIFASIAVFIFGLIVGLIEVIYLEKKFLRQAFIRKVLYKILIYAMLFSIMILITFPVAASMEMEKGLFSREVWAKYFLFLGSVTHFSALFQMSVSLVVSLLYAEIRNHLGNGVLRNFFTGKYQNPIETTYVFMFLDMRSSTTIAEQMGHIQYFQLLKEYYADLSVAVIEHGGNVYQYVGDEMVVTWPLKQGIHNSNCLSCFFKMKEDLIKRAPWYKEHFKVEPTFKAAIHCGKVTVGEIGVLKKEILFTGDVLNATSRIQDLCNTHNVDLLISEDLKQNIEWSELYRATSIGEIPLKGRRVPITLWTVNKT